MNQNPIEGKLGWKTRVAYAGGDVYSGMAGIKRQRARCGAGSVLPGFFVEAVSFFEEQCSGQCVHGVYLSGGRDFLQFCRYV